MAMDLSRRTVARLFLGQLLAGVSVAAPAAADTGHVIAEFHGNGRTNTQPFTVPNGWTIEWRSGDTMSITVYTRGGDLVDEAVGAARSGSGSSFEPKGGTFYLSVTSMSDWAVRIVTLPPP